MLNLLVGILLQKL